MCYNTKKKIQPKILERRKAAIRIQRNFRARNIQRYVKRLKNQAATVIQKYLKGFKVHLNKYRIVFER